MLRHTAVLRVFCLLLLLLCAASAGSVTVIGDGSGFLGPQVATWSASGIYAGGSDLYGKGFVWNGGTYTPVPSARDLSADGSVAVGATRDGDSFVPMRWTASGGAVSLGTLQPGQSGTATGVSADGSVVVGWSGSKPFRWTASGGMQPLGNPSSGNAWGVSGDGTVVTGWASINFQVQAYRWTQATGTVGLGTLPGSSGSAAYAISADGSTIVGTASGPDNTSQPIRWTQGDGMVGLGNPPGCERGSAMGVSGDGAVIIGECWVEGEESQTRIAFVWTAETGTQTVQDFLTQRGVVLDEPLVEPNVTAVSDDGRVIAVVETPFEFVRTRLIDVTPAAVPALPPLGALGLAAALLYIGMRSSSSRAT